MVKKKEYKKEGRRKTSEKSVKGVAKARQIAKKTQEKRSRRAKTIDSMKSAKTVYPMTMAGVEKWKKNPSRSDLKGIDITEKKKKTKQKTIPKTKPKKSPTKKSIVHKPIEKEKSKQTTITAPREVPARKSIVFKPIEKEISKQTTVKRSESDWDYFKKNYRNTHPKTTDKQIWNEYIRHH